MAEQLPNVSEHLALLGKTIVDKVTNFSGIASSVSFDLYGCIQVAITPPVDKDGKLVDGRWVDINRVKVVTEDRVMPIPAYAPTPAKHTHGPADKPAPR